MVSKFFKNFGEIFYKKKYAGDECIIRVLCFRFKTKDRTLESIKKINNELKQLQLNINNINESLYQFQISMSNVNESLNQIQLGSNANFSQVQTNISEKFKQLQNIVLPAMRLHPEVFSKYKDMYKGRDIVIVASGPTLNHYIPIKGAIHIGVNNTYKNDIVDLDYLFMQDGGTMVRPSVDKIANYRSGQCKKFFGYHYMRLEQLDTEYISQVDEKLVDAERYYFISHGVELGHPYELMNPDITQRPLNEWGSTTFAALDFALWTHPKRIFLVGCDCTANGYFKEQNSPVATTEAGYQYFKYGWEQMKYYIYGHYPDVEIISVNPIGLKGLYKDVYTSNYLEANNITDDNLEILNTGI